MTRAPLLTRPFLQLVAAHFMQALGFASMPLLPLYVAWLGASRAEVGAIMASASVGGLLLRPVAGWALDAIGRRVTVVCGTVVLASGMGVIGLVDALGPLVYVARVLIGIGAGTLFTAYFTFVADLIPPSRRTEGIALFGVSGLLPLALNPAVEQLGLPAAELRWVFPVIGVLVLASLLPLIGLPEPARHVDAPGVVPQRWLAAVTARPLRPVWLASIVFAGLVAVYMAFSTVVAAAKGVAEPANLWFGYAAAAVGVRLLGARLPDRVGPANLVAPALGCYAVAYLVAAGATSETGFVVSGALAGLAHGYCFPVLTAQVINRSPARLRGAAMATFTALWEVSAIGLTPLFGWIADATDDPTMLSAAVLCALTGLAAWTLLEHRLGEARASP